MREKTVRANFDDIERPVAGTGLGLSIVKSVLVRHGALYGVESKENQGSCFWFALKLREEIE